ncbi:STE/STE20/YSK protein kinase [Allomyces macrogynus ATCC 38327]|uniref:non-specific serine/threonine protein kinase n=1 Tax=Allomyces macrogynus (strain ATCC 38327) TaxID=578462 RepID=A0A0L0SGF2_ALLM3|nr:STE/STE20/YSK protein kinase [Allomyces macrogynus ATCC 38327]|eukprot:KNE61527.1 STE/STE20/YSK protein kinase [Allomyces macrogynus ATCC 38327]
MVLISSPVIRIDPEELYVKQERIGRGSFGEVYKGFDKRNKAPVAIKIIDLEQAQDEIEDIQQEIHILSQLDSTFVTKYYGSFIKGAKLWIVMEFCGGGSCQDLLKPANFEEVFIAIIMRELLRGLEYLHEQGKLHRDIKAANILLTQTGDVKLADFGVSGQLTLTMTRKNTFVGTPFWMAPEVISQTGYDERADIWSLGITAIELAQGQPPHADMEPTRALFQITKSEPPQLHGAFSRTFKEFVSLCLQKNPAARASAKDLLKHPFIRKAKRNSYLTELIERHEHYRQGVGGGASAHDSAGGGNGQDTVTNGNANHGGASGPDSDPRSMPGATWDFSTVRRDVPSSATTVGSSGSRKSSIASSSTYAEPSAVGTPIPGPGTLSEASSSAVAAAAAAAAAAAPPRTPQPQTPRKTPPMNRPKTPLAAVQTDAYGRYAASPGPQQQYARSPTAPPQDAFMTPADAPPVPGRPRTAGAAPVPHVHTAPDYRASSANAAAGSGMVMVGGVRSRHPADPGSAGAAVIPQAPGTPGPHGYQSAAAAPLAASVAGSGIHSASQRPWYHVLHPHITQVRTSEGYHALDRLRRALDDLDAHEGSDLVLRALQMLGAHAGVMLSQQAVLATPATPSGYAQPLPPPTPAAAAGHYQYHHAHHVQQQLHHATAPGTPYTPQTPRTPRPTSATAAVPPSLPPQAVYGMVPPMTPGRMRSGWNE